MLAWLIAMALAMAQAAPKPIETAHLTVTPAVGTPKAGKIPLHVDVTPGPNMHVYAPGQPGYVAIVLTLDADAPATVAGKARYPAGEKVFMPVLNETQLVYGKPFRITQEVVLRDAKGGPTTITGALRYQACDDRICYRPTTVKVSWTTPPP
jgi:hypothetical protein